ncbi:MAG TPA: hypothetical protein VFE51_21240 [Verrucomicrobiae bacterium]|nr:hypothetical protein [Verrucomicrobiae bacterium]
MSARAHHAESGWWAHLVWAISLFLCGLGSKLWLIHRSGVSLPYLDQWEAEAGGLYLPWLNHQLTFADLFRPNNEHRIVFTRLLDLGLFLLNRQWDNRVEMVVNALLHSATLAGFGWMLARRLGRPWWPAIWLLLAPVLVLPFDWENTLWGFQSMFYFLLLFSLPAIWLLAGAAPFSMRWWVGSLMCVAALFTMASGFLAAATVLVMVGLETARERKDMRRHLPTVAVCVVIVLAGLWLNAPMPRHYAFAAHSAAELLGSLLRNLSWPLIGSPWFALFNLLPPAVLGWVCWRSRREDLVIEKGILCTGIWTGLQTLALAYARGAGGKPPESRYMDTDSLLMITGGLSIVVLWSRHVGQINLRRWLPAVGAAWAVGIIAGLGWLTQRAAQREIPQKEFDQARLIESTREFLRSDSSEAFMAPDIQVPPLAPMLKLLRDPEIRRILPDCLRDPLEIAPAANQDGTFVKDGFGAKDRPTAGGGCWGSFSTNGLRAEGSWSSLIVKRSALPYLAIPVTGDLGEPGLSLELAGSASDGATPVRPPEIPRGTWRYVYVRAPLGAFQLVAQDHSATAWFGFQAPREVGLLTFWAARFGGAWKFVLGLGIGCWVVALVINLRKRA